MNMQIQKRVWCSKNTPAHDFNDFEVGKRNNLEFINIFDKNCNILDATFIPNEFRGWIDLKQEIKLFINLKNEFT